MYASGVVNFTIRPLYLQRNSPRYSLNWRLCWTQGRSCKLGEEKNVLPWPDSVLSKLQIGTVPLRDQCHARGPESMWLLLVRYHAIVNTKWYRSKSPSFSHSIGLCRMWQFLAVLRSFFHSSLLCTYFLPPFSTNYSSILSHLILPSISWSTSQPCSPQIHI